MAQAENIVIFEKNKTAQWAHVFRCQHEVMWQLFDTVDEEEKEEECEEY